MPTTVVKTIRASGGDYTTLTAWEAANQGNLVTADEIRVAECYDDWASGLDDKLVIDGSTTDATRYLMITVAAGHRHTGIPQSGFFVKKNVGYGALLWDSDLYTRLEWLDLENTNSNGQALYANAGSGIYSNLIAKTAGTSQYVVGLYSQNITIHGALVYGGGSGVVQLNSAIATNIYNSVATGCAKGFDISSALAVLKNCVAYNNTTNYSGTFSASSTNNATSSASDDAPGASSVVGITSADFVNAAGNDYHLAAGSALIGAGVNLYADFQADIDGDAWPSSGAWDIGFDRYVASGGSSVGLAIADAVHGHLSASLGLGADTFLAVADAMHAHLADALVITTDSVLAIADCAHAHAADAPVLTSELALVVGDSAHAHAADTLTLSVDGSENLAILDAAHAHSADAIVLTSEHLLAVADVSHTHQSDSLTLTDAPNLTVPDAIHAHAVDAPALTLDSTLAIGGALHGHLAGTVSLTYAATLGILGSLHAHQADSISFTFTIPDATLAWPDPSGAALAWPDPSGAGLSW